MTANRERLARRGLKLLGADRFVAFLQAARQDGDCFAVRLASDELEQGVTVEALFFTGDEFGFSLDVVSIEADRYHVAFGCQAGPLAGDGGEWDVCFRPDGTVASIESGMSWMS